MSQWMLTVPADEYHSSPPQVGRYSLWAEVIKKWRKVVEQDWIAPHERVVVFNTGTGLKQPV